MDVIGDREQGVLVRDRMEAHSAPMKSNQPLFEKLNEVGGSPERGYDAWNSAKVEKGLKQTKDRDAMIPVSRILHGLDLAIQLIRRQNVKHVYRMVVEEEDAQS